MFLFFYIFIYLVKNYYTTFDSFFFTGKDNAKYSNMIILIRIVHCHSFFT
jgi:hypothetical protein